MGHHRGEFVRGVSKKFEVMVSIMLLLIGVERAHAIMEFAPGSWVSESAVTSTSGFLLSSMKDRSSALPSASREGSASIVRPERGPVVEDELSRRELISKSLLYIGYQVLTAGNIPCPPRSGRSYYTPNCRSASGPVRPYRRGCSAIGRCARS